MINETFKNNLNSIGVELTDRQYEQFDMYYIDANGDKISILRIRYLTRPEEL